MKLIFYVCHYCCQIETVTSYTFEIIHCHLGPNGYDYHYKLAAYKTEKDAKLVVKGILKQRKKFEKRK